MNLHPSQEAAIAYIEQHAESRSKMAHDLIEEVRAMSNIAPAALNHAIKKIKANACIALHFHPDRIGDNGLSVATSLLKSGVYKNQFETKLSNGMLSPYAGGPRDLWESGLFGGAYSSAASGNTDRPKYGALDLMRHSDGPSPRFGSCYFILKQPVSNRATFTYMDSHKSPEERGTLNNFDCVMAGLLAESFERQYALGEKDLPPARLITHLAATINTPYPDPAAGAPARNLNHYIEAQVHGPVNLAQDVAMLVADPSFGGNMIGEQLTGLCDRYNIPLRWHQGFCMQVSDVPLDFRGPGMPTLAARISKRGWICASTIGEAAAELKNNPDQWNDRGSYAQCLQELKLLWHVLVKYGQPHATMTKK